MTFPSPIKPGDTIGLIAPCSPLKPERLLQCIQTVTALGYHSSLGKSVTKNLHGYLAGSDKTRTDDINQMFSNPGIDAIFCLRGGYGSTRIMDRLDYPMIQEHPKIFVGYSDITSFHLAFYSLCGLVTFHGPMVSSNMTEDYDCYSRNSLERVLQLPSCSSFTNPDGYPLQTIVSGRAKGRIIGGCLSLVSPSIGTFYEPDFNDTILFLEDIDETVPRCDKLMHHLKNSGIFTRVNGVILGNFKDCENPNDKSYTIYHFFQDFFQDYQKPVIWGLQSGHDKPMGTIPLGTMCSLDADSGKVVFEFY